ncbi:amino acid permease-domain-containing protein [Xylariomycetidae sp. FL0641]|nr:amino acid permease-domain-containing protein [Xylariomycetidae sp. FL0641]
MVPPPLELNGLVSSHSRRGSAYAREAITTAASPFRHNFELNLRSPCTPCSRFTELPRSGAGHSHRHSSSASYLTASNAFASLDPVAEAPAKPEGRTSIHGYDIPSSTIYSPSDQPWNVMPTTPALLSEKPRDDEGKLGVMSAINIIVGKTLGVGAYTIPSSIFAGVGSVGMSLTLWIIGSIVSFCGLAVYLDLGTAIPKSGGEKVYLERIFRHPYMLASCMFMSYVVLLGFSAPNAIVLGDYVLYILSIEGSRWSVRGIAVIVVTAICYLHARHPRFGLKVINVLGMGKLVILAIVVLSGVAGGLMGVGKQPVLTARRFDPVFSEPNYISTAQRNFSDIWEGSSMQPYNYATALLKVIYCFRGYSTANQVLSDVKNPVRTLKIAAPVALGIVSVAYLAVNVAFFLVVDKEDFKSSGVIVAGIFFRNIFGETIGAHVLPLFVIISAAGNIAATAFAQARVNEELAKDGLLPSSAFWTTSKPEDHSSPLKGKAPLSRKATPTRGLLLHWLVTVAVIILPPTDRIYNFLVNIGGYPVSVVSVSISAGLLYLQLSPSQRWQSPVPASRIAIAIYLSFNALLLVLPWIPPANGQRSDSGFPYYAYPVTALVVLGSGALYWIFWKTKGNGKASIRRCCCTGRVIDGEEGSRLMSREGTAHCNCR